VDFTVEVLFELLGLFGGIGPDRFAGFHVLEGDVDLHRNDPFKLARGFQCVGRAKSPLLGDFAAFNATQCHKFA
jgi:hypothetical protein